MRATGELSPWKSRNDSHLTGTAEVPSDGYLLITVPYEGGWELTLDGEKQEILKADLGLWVFVSAPEAILFP
mgnify:CR=1 FL=1